jgi:hypothetical protein
MIEKQLSVFIENKQGRLGEVLQVLKDNEVNIQSLSLADTTEYGLLRLIVDKPEVGKDKLFEAGFSSMLTSVLIVDVPHSPGSLQTVLKTIVEKEINVEYMYGLTIKGDTASIVMKTDDLEKASKAFGL